MSFTPVLALGLLSQSIFFGGNVAVSALFIPNIRQKQVPATVQIKLWERLYDDASKLMAASAATSFCCYVYESLSAPCGSEARQAFAICAGFSISVIPFTFLAIMPTVKKIKSLTLIKTDKELETQDFGFFIDRWSMFSLARMLLFSIGFGYALFYHVKNSV